MYLIITLVTIHIRFEYGQEFANVTSSVTLQEKNKNIHKPSNFVRSITVNGIFLCVTKKIIFKLASVQNKGN